MLPSASKAGAGEVPKNIVATLRDRRCVIVSDSSTEAGALCVAADQLSWPSDARDGLAPS